jgi:hypothetical protein
MTAIASPRIKVSKQSLIDWQVTDEAGKPVAWITKEKLGYLVKLHVAHTSLDKRPTYFEVSFAAAKECARGWLALDNQPTTKE